MGFFLLQPRPFLYCSCSLPLCMATPTHSAPFPSVGPPSPVDYRQGKTELGCQPHPSLDLPELEDES